MSTIKRKTGDSQQLETRSLGQAPEIREAEDGRPAHLTGYAAVFDTEAVIGGLFREKFMPGAFTKTLQEFDQRALYNHQPGAILGRKSNGSLSLTEDADGLLVDLALPATTLGDDTRENVRTGLVDGQSIGFQVVKAAWDERGALPLRIINEARLQEVSITPFPAYQTTSISEARSIMDAHKPAENTTITPQPDADATPDGPEPDQSGHSEAETCTTAINQRAIELALAENEV